LSLRWKIALALAALTFVASAAIGVAVYRVTKERLFNEIDRSLSEINPRPGRGPLGIDPLGDRGPLRGFEAQVVLRDGTVAQTTFEQAVSNTDLVDAAASVAGRPGASTFDTVTVNGDDYRVRTVGFPRGSLQVARSLDETQRVLRDLRVRTFALALVVAGIAAVLGVWIANSVTSPLRRLTDAAEHVGTTGRLDVPVGSAGDDEVGRLSAAFDRMLAALARSREQQQRLVQDAGHELRTPLTSIRTNVDVLRRHPDLAAADREAVIDDLHAEAEQLTELVNEIVAVAVGDVADEPREPVDLAELAADVVARYERRSGREIVVVAQPTLVVAQRAAVQRALSCLLDNATKFDPSGAPIEVSVGDQGIAVADRGIGIPENELSLVFERFHRTAEARAMPGSGLGLSIVRDVAERHGGSVSARNRQGGGAVVGFRLSPV
jgi:two-component system, OmpR family, sensor histidine kinase MprB